MASPADQPRLGAADLTAGERTRSHRSRLIQPHGALLVVAEPALEIRHVSANAREHLGRQPRELLGKSLDIVGFELSGALRTLLHDSALTHPHPLRVHIPGPSGPRLTTVLVHRSRSGHIIVELEALPPEASRPVGTDVAQQLTALVTELSGVHSFRSLADLLARDLRRLLGYDRVLVHRFDAEGHGTVVAEAKDAALESWLERHYPATDLPPHVRDRFLHTKVRCVVNAQSAPVPLEPIVDGMDLDLSGAVLRSVSPRHVQDLHRMGVTATVVAALVHDGTLWGLITCQHQTPRALPYDLRAAVELIADVASTRISALEHFAEAQAEVLVRRLERRLIEATSTDGDWRRALFDSPRQLLQPLGASGGALLFDGEVQTTGEVPSTTDLRALFAFLDRQEFESVLAIPSMAKRAPELAALTPVASGVLAVRLGATRGEYLVWFRREQLQDVTWGGRPVHRERVHDTAIPWTPRESSIAKAIGASLRDIVLQIRAVRVLIAEAQLQRMRTAVLSATDPVIIADEDGTILVANDALAQLLQGPFATLDHIGDLAARFEDGVRVLELFESLRFDRRPWRGELRLLRPQGGEAIPVAVRADPIPQANGGLFGFIFILNDLTSRHAADVARDRLQQAAAAAQRSQASAEVAEGESLDPAVQRLISAIWANAGVAVSEIADSADTDAIAPLLHEVEQATRHAARLSALLGRFNSGDSSSVDA